MLTFLAAHWKPMLASAAVAGAAAWFLKPDPQPVVKLQEQEHTQETTQAATDQTVQAGPVRVVETVEEYGTGTSHDGRSPSAGDHGGGRVRSDLAQDQVVRRIVTVTEQGPTTTETHSDTRATASDDRKLDLTVTPQARAGWALQVGLEDVLHGGQVRVAARRRLLGPFWAEVAALPRTRAVGVSLAVEF